MDAMNERAEGRAGQLVSFKCDEHGQLWQEAAFCQHDIDAVIAKVIAAHGAPYGAVCAARVTVTLIDAETGQPTNHSRHWRAS